MNILEKLKKYTPYDDAEKASVEACLKFIEKFGDDIYTRDNILGHVCGSAWIINKKRNKVLLAHHNIYNSYNWLGGHNDGEIDTFNVAKREVFEESGLKNVKPLNNSDFIDVNMEFVIPHVRKGNAINAHLHIVFVYLFEADENEPLKVNDDEHSSLRWFDNKDVQNVADIHMRDIYRRIMKKIVEFKL